MNNNSEFLFLWDAKMCNPNGDMLNDNAPRFDEIDNRAIVSDVRVKRTIRDDLQYRKDKLIFVNNAEEVQSAETRFKELNEKDLSQLENELKALKKNKASKEEVLKKEKEIKILPRKIFLSCIDNRLYGGVAPKSGIQIIGAVQYSWAKTLNETETILSQGTGAFGQDEATMKTFRTDNYIPYGLFAMYGMVNKNNAKKSKVSEDDIDDMFNSMWMGTKLLNTRTKTGQKPRFLIKIVYKEDTNYMIGLIDELVKLNNENSETIRTFQECDINFNELIETIIDIKDKIEKVVIVYDKTAQEYLEQFKIDGVNLEVIQEVNFC